PRDDLEARAAKRFTAMLAEDLNVKEIEILDVDAESPLTYTVKPNFKTLGAKLGKQMKPAAKAIAAAADYLLRAYRKGDESLSVTLADGDVIPLGRGDLQLSSEAPDDQTVSEDRGTWVAFDTTISEALAVEGSMRDLLRRLQMERKERDFEIEDRIAFRWKSEGERIQAVFSAWGDTFERELLCTHFEQDPSLDAEDAETTTIKLAGELLLVHLQKATQAS
ncbi:MAG: hypothetical protein KAI47_07120, partial [Deltaproteobacteria bacterium]|nr:hypothetical protein [Deltaproteobacteria bacterium]